MTDREMLELVAKAAGVGPVIGFAGGSLVIGPKNWQRFWSPLGDNGDALSLAVRRHIRIEQDKEKSISIATYHEDGWAAMEPHGDDPEKATRRAVVIAVVHQHLAEIESPKGRDGNADT